MQLIGFSDASERAFAAVVYVRAEYIDGSISCCMADLLGSMSIPRLELAWYADFGKIMIFSEANHFQ